MQNITMNTEKNQLVIKIDLDKNGGLSKSGKSEIIASTAGNKPVPGAEDIKIGINCYRPVS